MNEDMFESLDGEEETLAETVEEVIEETEVLEDVVGTEDDTEVVDGFYEEDAEEVEAEQVYEFDANYPENAEEFVEEVAEEVPAKKGKGALVTIIVIMVLVLALAGFCVYKLITRNPYNAMGYINASGRTVADIAADSGITVEEFLVEYSLPADMPADTEEAAAWYSIPTKKIAEMNMMTLDQIKELFGLGEDVTAITPWGEAEGKMTVGKYLELFYNGQDIEEFKKEYELSDKVTVDTLWGEIRNEVDKKTLEKQEAEEETANAQTDVQADVEPGTVVEDSLEEEPEAVIE